MTGSFWLDWALIAVSLFNTILLLWLGLTVLLNADRRSPGIWLMGGGLLAGGAFFISHTAILGHDPGIAAQSLNFWWQVGWIPVIISPFAWYVMILWYSGFWDAKHGALRRRHRVWLIQLSLLGAVLIALMLSAHPIPSFTQLGGLNLSAAPTMGGIPVLFVLFPPFIVLCIALSLDALRDPAPSERLMGDRARQRTRPWLATTAVLLLAVSLLVTCFVVWVIRSARGVSQIGVISLGVVGAAGWVDLIIESLIGLAVVALGQGIVSYEVFTGKALPRRGFFRHWRSATILALGYATVIGLALTARLPPVYSLLLTTALMTTFYALFSWRSFVEREQSMARLRPFVGSQHFVQRLVASNPGGRGHAEAVFQSLCDTILNTSRAQLVPLGPLAPMAGPALPYPPTEVAVDQPPLPDLSAAHEIISLANKHEPYNWAISLWGERGVIGALLLSEKQDGNLYTQEEVEIARASCERLIDLLAGEELSRRLMALQRRRLAETQVMDRQTRRALHDEILPDLHTAILGLSSQCEGDLETQKAIGILSKAHRQIADLIRIPPTIAFNPLQAGGFIEALRQAVQSEFGGEFDAIHWRSEGEVPELDPLTAEVVFHAVREAVRNAALHGRGADREHPLSVNLSIQAGEALTIRVTDNGVGIPRSENGWDQSPGGLTLHSTLLAIVGGSLSSVPDPEGGTTVTIGVPLPRLAGSRTA